MSLRDDIPELLDYIKSNAATINHNAILFDIYEGYLVEYVLKDLKKQLSPQSFDQIQHRVAPINVLKRVVDKLSKIYADPPARSLLVENEIDQDLFHDYSKELDINTYMQIGNEFFNLFKSCAIEPFVNNRKPALRIIPSDRFLVWSNDSIDPVSPTHFIKFMGKKTVINAAGNKESRTVYYIYTKDEFLPITEKGEILFSILNEINNPNGINPVGKFPVTYINRSRHNLIPQIDTDILRMTKLFPVLLTDLNFAVMYQAFSIIYGIDVDNKNISMSPNAFWSFKSDPTTQTKPEVGVIKPQVDITQVMGFILGQLAFWLQSKNIRPGSVGTTTPETFASGVSKVVDEMDTYEERQKQVPYFRSGESALWDLIMHGYHPFWVKEGMIDETREFQSDQSVDLDFPPQRPLVKRIDTLTDIEKEITLRLTTRKESIQRLNPNMTEQEVDDFILQIDEEGTITIPGASPIAQGDHLHKTGIGDSSPMFLNDTGTGHYHLVGSGRTSTEENTAGHTHGYGDERTGPPIAIQTGV